MRDDVGAPALDGQSHFECCAAAKNFASAASADRSASPPSPTWRSRWRIFGSNHRLDYTILGSPVNLAARLQTAAEADTILMSESTYTLLQDVALCARTSDMQLKGFARPIACYRLDGLKGDGAVEGAEGLTGPMIRAGNHVSVNIPDRLRIREAIEELRFIEQELEREMPKP